LQLCSLAHTLRMLAAMKTFHCDRCQQLVFFENVLCERCNAMLGYVPEVGEICAFEQAGDDRWRSLHPASDGALFRQCANYAIENVCNWMIPVDAPHSLCRACRFNGTIPNLEIADNRGYWYRLETAKRRLLYTLTALGLEPESRAENLENGLQFDFLQSMSHDDVVTTGHQHGVVTINVAEADDACREQMRQSLHEPYRTLLGHFRHEVGHYFFDRLVKPSHWLEPFRRRFGDETVDYAAALDTYYRNGPPPDWAQSFVSAYASMHPWEDWAESWAHYLHMVDTIDTSVSCGLALLPHHPHEPALTDQTPVEDAGFSSLMARWFPLTYVLNSLNRSLGAPDGYPFTLSPPVVDKLRFVHAVIVAAAAQRVIAFP
jgi:hypothetical protein